MPSAPLKARAKASPNIALIKYWGNRDHRLRLPANGSISITLSGLETEVTVVFSDLASSDTLTINGVPREGGMLQRVSDHLGLVRKSAGIAWHATVESKSNYPTGVGIASSAAAFAALTLAACSAAGLSLSATDLSRMARRGSGSACRSIFGGFVEWFAGDSDDESYAEPIAPAEHWPLVDLVAVVSEEHKAVGSSAGHALAETSPLQRARVEGAPDRLRVCREALLSRDFDALAHLVELDSNLLHAVMLTSTPRLMYWEPATLLVMASVGLWRQAGLPVCFTVDAGPNVHCLCLPDSAGAVADRLRELPGVKYLIRSGPGGPARLVAGDEGMAPPGMI